MKKAFFSLFSALFAIAPGAGATMDIETVRVGNPGNAPKVKGHPDLNDSEKVSGSLKELRLQLQWKVDGDPVNMTFEVSPDYRTLKDKYFTWKRR